MIIRGTFSLKDTLGSGTGDPALTRDSTTGEVGQVSGNLSQTLSNGNIFVGNVSNIATGVTPSGDITLTNAGVFGIASGVIVNADISASAAIAYSKLNLAGSIVNADVSNSAAIAYSKLNLASSVVNADISASAAITRSKMANGTAYRILANNSSGVLSENAAITASRAIISDVNGQLIHATTTATEIGYVNGVTSSIQNQLNQKIVGQSTSSTLQSPGAGQNGYVITWDNTNNRFNLTSISAAGVPNGGTTGQALVKASNTDQDTTWHSLVFGDLTDVSGTTVTEINLLSGMTVTATDLNQLSGIGGNVQTQLNNKLGLTLTTDSLWKGVGGIATETTDLPTGTTIGTAYVYRSGGTDVSPADGGTGISSYTIGDILYASGTTTLSKLADVATGNALISGGVGTAPSWGKIDLSTHVSGNLPVTNLNSGTSASSSTFWRGDGTWATPTAGAAGSNTQVQYNNSGALAGSATFTWNNASAYLSIGSAGTRYSETGINPITNYSINPFNRTGATGYSVAIQGGAMASGTGDGGLLSLVGGTCTGTGNGGSIYIQPGSAGAGGVNGSLFISSGTNKISGTSVLVGGTVTVSNTLVTANSKIFLTSQVDGGTPGFLRISARSAGTSFTITSSSGTDTSTVAWLIIEPA